MKRCLLLRIFAVQSKRPADLGAPFPEDGEGGYKGPVSKYDYWDQVVVEKKWGTRAAGSANDTLPAITDSITLEGLRGQNDTYRSTTPAGQVRSAQPLCQYQYFDVWVLWQGPLAAEATNTGST
jgi:hypothetical protein